jgi:hypothetical protein
LNHSSELLHSTCAFWQRWCRQRLTDEDARQIIENVRGYFGVLDSWHRCEAASTQEGPQAVHEEEIAANGPTEVVSPRQGRKEICSAGTSAPELEKTA